LIVRSEEILEVINALVAVVDPTSGEEFTSDHVCKQPEIIKALAAVVHIVEEQLDKEMLESLKLWRLGKANELSLPAFCVFSDAVLHQLVEIKPLDYKQLISISGIGESKLQNFGEDIIRLVGEHCQGAPASSVVGGELGEERIFPLSSSESKENNVYEAVHERFGVDAIGGPARFYRPGWFYIGPAVTDCPECSSVTEAFRKPYITKAGIQYHYWALFCSKCRKLMEPKVLGDKKNDLYNSSELRPSDMH